MKREESDKIKSKFQIIFDYITSKEGQISFYLDLKKTVDEAYENNNIKVLREINKEMNVWLVEMFRPNERKELNQLLKEKLGEDIEHLDQKRIERIKKIIKRGKINTQDEYSLLQQRVEEIYADDSKKVEVEELNNILAGFHK
jgi:hypothetical protein